MWPTYQADLNPKDIETAYERALDIISQVGMTIENPRFLDLLKGRDHLAIKSQRVLLDRDHVKQEVEAVRRQLRDQTRQSVPAASPAWKMNCGGWSMNVIDLDTEKIRLATCDDLRDLVRLCEGYGCSGPTPVYPQDIPPVMREIAAYKICYENSAGGIDGSLYSRPEQAPVIYDMTQVMGRPFIVTICVTEPMRLVASDLDNFIQWYGSGKKFRVRPVCYNLPGITGPITPLGSAMLYMAEFWSTSLIFKAIAPSCFMGIPAPYAPLPVDFRNCCWAFGSPRSHLAGYLSHQLNRWFAMQDPDPYHPQGALLMTSSSAVDFQAGAEKMACALAVALQGARTFDGLGNLCVDDLFSPVQFVLDVEVVEYIKDLVGAFAPPKEFLGVEEMYEAILDSTEGKSTFLSHDSTVGRFKTLYPSSDILVRQKLPSFLVDPREAKHRAAAIARKRMNECPFVLAEDQQKALQQIYASAFRVLGTHQA